MSEVVHFGFTKLVVKDLAASDAFYTKVCGLTHLGRVQAVIAGREIDEIMYNATGTGAATFVLLTYTDMQKPSSEEVILGFQTADIVAFVERVKAAGGAVSQEITSMPEHGVKVAFVTDNEGHLIEVVEMLAA